MPERTSYAWEDARIGGGRPFAVLAVQLDGAELFYAQRPLRPVELTTTGALFSSSVLFSSTVLFNGGRTVLENAGRLLHFAPVRESLVPFETALASSSGRIEQPEIVADLDNGDGALSVIAGEQFLLGRTVKYLASIGDLEVRNALARAIGAIVRVRLTSRTLTIEARA